VRIGVLGTGTVGETVATKLVELGHDVRMGARDAANEKARDWADAHGASHGTFADAADHGEIVFNCTNGAAALEALEAAGDDAVRGKILVDVSNPLDFSHGFPPTLTVCNDDSLAERIQRRFPETRVVKALNTVTASVMVEPGLLPEETNLLICGDDDGAKRDVAALLETFGWPAARILDLGPIAAARGTEMYLPLWLRLMGALGTPQLNLRIVRADG
jgi:predicted dinucleotide-binding enzyme